VGMGGQTVKGWLKANLKLTSGSSTNRAENERDYERNKKEKTC